MNNKGNIFVIAIVAILILVFVFGFSFFDFSSNSSTSNSGIENEGSNSGDTETSEEVTITVKEFSLEGKNFMFLMNGEENPTIRVSEGDEIRIVFTNIEGTHDLVLDGFGVRTQIIGSGDSEIVEFVADKKGTFEYYCSVGEHRALGMEGTFIVE